MRYLLAFLLLTSTAFAQKPRAPFSDPNDPDDPAMKLAYTEIVTVPEASSVVWPNPTKTVFVIAAEVLFLFPEPFGRPPSCSFEGGTIPGVSPEINTEYVSIKAKSGEQIYYRCQGVRREEKPDAKV